MRFEQLDYLIAIHQYRSMNKAAEAIFVSQQGISKAIRELEDEMQIKLLYKNNKGSFLTGDALKLIESIQEFYAVYESIKEKNINHRPEQLHIILDFSLSPLMWEFIYVFFQKNYPDIILKLSYFDYCNFEDQITMFPDAIVIVYCEDDFYHANKDKYHTKLIDTQPLSLFLSNSSPIIHYNVISLKSIKNMEILLFTSEDRSSAPLNILRKYNIEKNNNKLKYYMTGKLILKELEENPKAILIAPKFSMGNNLFVSRINLKEKISLHLCCFSKASDIPEELVNTLRQYQENN